VDLVYKIDYFVQSSLSSSLVLTLIQDSFNWPTLRSCDCNTQNLRVDQKKEPYIEFTQENSIESSVLDCLSYVLNSHDYTTTTLAYPK